MLASAVRSALPMLRSFTSRTVSVPTTQPSGAASGRMPTKRTRGPEATSGCVARSVAAASSMKRGDGEGAAANANDCSRGR